MPLTEYQKTVCRLLAAERVARGEGYVAGGVALNELLKAPRVSRDVDLFHDTQTALLSAWEADRQLLTQHGFTIQVLRELPAFIEAAVSKDGEGVVFQWLQDSAYRFFPLVTHPDFGLVLHPFDLATNKILALVGRVEVRDWVDIISCDHSLQPFGYLVWAAAGKDLGLSPDFILAEAARSAHYTRDEVNTLAFAGAPPVFTELAAAWCRMLRDAGQIVARLPEDFVGCCVCDRDGQLFKAEGEALTAARNQNALLFHKGSVKGAWPQLKG